MAGDLASYVLGPFLRSGLQHRFQRLSGAGPEERRHDGSRPNYALYLDMQADVAPPLQLGVAARYEDFYKDFGNTLNGKLSALWRASDRVTLRSTASTGFRAPSPGQAHLTAVTTGFSGAGGLTEQGHVPPTHPIAAALGGVALTEEKSVGFSVGTAVELTDELDLTFDYFDISIKDRMSLTGNIKITEEIARLIQKTEALQGVSALQEIKFFSNDFDTGTRGIDLVLSWRRAWNSQSLSTVDLGLWNWTTGQPRRLFAGAVSVTEFLGTPLAEPIDVSLLTPRRQVELEEMNPEHRLVLTGRHQLGSWNAMLRPTYFSAWKACRFQDNDCGDLDSTSTGASLSTPKSAMPLTSTTDWGWGCRICSTRFPIPPPRRRRARAICARRAPPGTTTGPSGTRACLWNSNEGLPRTTETCVRRLCLSD